MTDQQDATLGLAKLVLRTLSPAEEPLVEVVGPALLTGRPANDGALGFGVDDLSWLVTAVPVTKVAVDLLLDSLKDVATKQIGEAVSAWLSRLIRVKRSQPEAAVLPLPLPADLLGRVHDGTYQHALTIGLDESRARLIADAVTGNLALSSG